VGRHIELVAAPNHSLSSRSVHGNLGSKFPEGAQAYPMVVVYVHRPGEVGVGVHLRGDEHVSITNSSIVD
jgi:hypothetical protein